MSKPESVIIAESATKYVEEMLVDLLASGEQDNRVCLGTLLADNSEIQIQLVIPRNPSDLLDD